MLDGEIENVIPEAEVSEQIQQEETLTIEQQLAAINERLNGIEVRLNDRTTPEPTSPEPEPTLEPDRPPRPGHWYFRPIEW